MKQLKDKINAQVNVVLEREALAAEGMANQLRLFFALLFGAAAIWSWSRSTDARYIYLAAAVLWLVVRIVIGRRTKQEAAASLVNVTALVDLTIINLGMAAFAWRGLFYEGGAGLYFCYFPVLAVAAARYRTGLLLKAGLYAGVVYTVIALLAGSVPWWRLAMLLAVTAISAAVARKPRKLMINAASEALQEAYELGAKSAEIDLINRVHEVLLPSAAASSPGLWVISKHAAGVQTGGDYSQVFETAQGEMVVVGELPGEGLEATLCVGRLHNTLTQIVASETTLSGIVEKLNKALWQQYQGTRQFRGVFAIWEDEQLHYINAGHLPAIQVSKQQLSRLPVNASPVGASEGASFTSATVSFPARDLLLLYTDGIYAKLTDDREKGIAEVERLTEKFRHGEVNTLCYRVFDVAQPGNDPPKDDVTVVVVRRQGGGAG